MGEVDRQVRPVALELGNQAGDEAVQEEWRAADPQRSLAASPQPLEVIGGAQRRRADCPPLICEDRAGGCQLKRFAHTMEDGSPSRCSSIFTTREIAGWLVPRLIAASVKPPASLISAMIINVSDRSASFLFPVVPAYHFDIEFRIFGFQHIGEQLYNFRQVATDDVRKSHEEQLDNPEHHSSAGLVEVTRMLYVIHGVDKPRSSDQSPLG